MNLLQQSHQKMSQRLKDKVFQLLISNIFITYYCVLVIKEKKAIYLF